MLHEYITLALGVAFAAAVVYAAKLGFRQYKWGALVVVFLIGGIATIFRVSFTTRNLAHTYNTERMNRLKEIQLNMELYFDEHQHYPEMFSTCQNIPEAQFPEIFQEGGLWHDPKTEQGHPDFQIAVSQNSEQYVLRAVFDEGPNGALQTDVDGQVLGCDCDDPAFCLTNQ